MDSNLRHTLIGDILDSDKGSNVTMERLKKARAKKT
jgi:hypothetical protein